MHDDFKLTGWSSAAIHAGHSADPTYAHQVPIYATSSFVYDTAEQGMRRFSGKEEGYIYSRWGNPTITAAEDKIAALECFGFEATAESILHSSGMAAISTLLIGALNKGDKILTHFSLYGGTEELMSKVLPTLGIDAVIADLRDLQRAEDAIKNDRSIKLIYIETPANPTIQCVDIEELTKIARRHNLLVACDNTFATPWAQQPFRYGVDFIVHSTTKFLNGHGTAIGGILLGTDIEKMKGHYTKVHRLLGGNSNPFDAFMLVQGIKTLDIRMQAHCNNAKLIAQYLQTHNSVQSVDFPGLPTHPDHAVAKKQMREFGAVISFELKKGLQGGIDFMNKLKMCVRTVSLGTVDTLLSHPASMTHYGVPKEQRETYGITDGLIRMNVGIENVEDILGDLEQALE